jgi:hypothetical protein
MTHTINVPLARKVLAQIHAAPERWTQSVWLNRPYEPVQQAPENTVDNCETSGCFAGWTAVLDGYKTDLMGTIRPESVTPEVSEQIRNIYASLDWYDTRDLRDVSESPRVQHVATAALGLTYEQSAQLFEANNTLRDLYAYLEEWTDGEIATPDELPVWADMTDDEKSEYFEDLELGGEAG